jgi:hypothetical protein
MHGEPEHEMNQSNNQITVAKEQNKNKKEDSKQDKLQPRNTVFQKDFQRTKIQTTSPKL